MEQSAGLRYDRLYRTLSSEAHMVSLGEQPLGRLELHYAQSTVYGVLLLDQELPEPALRALISELDDDLVWTAGVNRDDFVLSVFVGREVGVYDDEARGADSTNANGDNGH